MPKVAELTAAYERFMLAPRHGPGVCRTCFNLTDGYSRCYACSHGQAWLDAVAPISYSVAHEQLHQALASYKRTSGDVARRHAIQLAAVLWRYLKTHERCVLAAARTTWACAGNQKPASWSGQRFELVTTVPSDDRQRDERHPLRWLVGEVVAPTSDRHERLLTRSERAVDSRTFNPHKYETARALGGESVLLIDDTWTTGASAQSAAAALKSAGAGPVAAVVIGRHLNREWHENDRRLQGIAQPFDWDRCAFCAPMRTGGLAT